MWVMGVLSVILAMVFLVWPLPGSPQEETRKSPSIQVGALAITKDLNKVLIGSGGRDQDFTLRIWDLVTSRELARLEGHKNRIYTVAYSGDETKAVSGGPDGLLILWRLDRKESRIVPLNDLAPIPETIYCVRLSHDAKVVALSTANGRVLLYDFESGKRLLTLAGHHRNVFCLTFADEQQLLTGGMDCTARLWDLATGRELLRLKHDHPVTRLAASLKKPLLATSCGTNTVQNGQEIKTYCAHLWTKKGQELCRWTGFEDTISSVCFSPSGNRLAVASGQALRLFDTSNGQEVWRALAASPIVDVRFSEDGRRLAGGNRDAQVQVWDLPAP